MTVVDLYCYREGRGYTVSPRKPADGVEYSLRARLIADEGRAVTDGRTITTCIDVDSAYGWHDCDLPEEDEE